MSLSSPLFALLTMVPVVATLLLGAQLRSEFTHEIIRTPRPFMVGLAGQLLLLPLLAVLFFIVYPVPPDTGGCWFILAAVPGGSISNMVTFLGRGRLSLSVVLTACSTLAGVVTIPLWVNIGMKWTGGGTPQPLSTTSMVVGSFLILILPLSIGIALSIWNPGLAERLRKPTRAAMVFLLLLGLGAYLAQRWNFIVTDFNPVLFVGAALFHSVAVLGSWSVARALRLDRRDSFTVGIEVGVQNVVIALLIVELLDRSDLVPFVGYYALLMTGMLFLWLVLLARPSDSGQAA